MPTLRLLALLLIAYVPSVSAQTIRVVDYGSWSSNFTSPSGLRYGWSWDANAWFDVELENHDSTEVGMVWSIDGWQTVHEVMASFDYETDKDTQLWSIDLKEIAHLNSCFWCSTNKLRIEFALFSRNGFVDRWENNQGHNFFIEIPGSFEGELQ